MGLLTRLRGRSTPLRNHAPAGSDDSYSEQCNDEPATPLPLLPYYRDYFIRMLGHHKHPRPPPPPHWYLVYLWSFIAAFIAIAVVAIPTYVSNYFTEHHIPTIIGSFGATAVLLYGTIDAPLAQPRNLVLGHLSSAIWGVVINTIFNAITSDPDSLRWLSCALAVAGSITIMQALGAVHPPGGATALIAVSGGAEIYDLGFLYIAIPVLFGVIIMLLVALAFNNIQRHYPVYWWKKKAQQQPLTNNNDSSEEEEKSGKNRSHHTWPTTTLLPLEPKPPGALLARCLSHASAPASCGELDMVSILPCAEKRGDLVDTAQDDSAQTTVASVRRQANPRQSLPDREANMSRTLPSPSPALLINPYQDPTGPNTTTPPNSTIAQLQDEVTRLRAVLHAHGISFY
ncbi:hypothetical protein H4R34_005456 [Dimargaris verticillata]|uniref:HPP transmembrane region domain-containing protein n=1 Tax=Dimargaris verticillata TaxID=2761393 RepID=A0A9W8AWV9_9FUNG|nr:hypothetical protein H4R34_005456 [Dimargaris verticillata]